MTFGREGPSISDLVRVGIVKPGDMWIHRGRRPEDEVKAFISEDGGLRIGDRGYDNPSRAAKAVSGVIHNGWTYWQVERRGTLVPAGELRLEYERRSQPSRPGRGKSR